MILVCLSHVRYHFEDSVPILYSFLTISTRVATPTFLLLSGFVIGHLLRGNSRGRVGVALIDRGLFLLIVAHGLLGWADVSATSFAQWWLARTMITDVVGMALFIAVLARGASTAALLTAGVAMCALSWVIAMSWLPSSATALFVGSLLFYLDGAPQVMIEVPLLAYVGVFLIGMALSSSSHTLLVEGNHGALARRLAVIGGGAVLLVALGVVGWHVGKDALPPPFSEAHVVTLLRSSLNPGSKLPPGPAYLLFYGGLGLLMTAAFCWDRLRRALGPLARRAAVIGRASLLCFVVQDWLFFVLPKAFGYADVISVGFWSAYFVACVLVLYLLAKAWGSVGGNRFLTVGLKWLAARRPPHGAGSSSVRTV